METPTLNPERADALLAVLLVAISSLAAKVDAPKLNADASISEMQQWVFGVLRLVRERIDMKEGER